MSEKVEEVKIITLYVIIGILSGVIEVGDTMHRNKTKFEKFTIGATAFCFAVFVTPTFIWLIEIYFNTSIPQNVNYGVCFFSGKFGERTLSLLMHITKKIDWKTILLALITKKKDENN